VELLPLAVLAHLLDPVRALVTLAGVVLWRGPRAMLLAAGISAIVCETVLTTANVINDFPYRWGEGLVAGVLASLAQAALFYLIVELARQRRDVGVAADAAEGPAAEKSAPAQLAGERGS
jgi:hypothetical protein